MSINVPCDRHQITPELLRHHHSHLGQHVGLQIMPRRESESPPALDLTNTNYCLRFSGSYRKIALTRISICVT
jgi:hypothetical protein